MSIDILIVAAHPPDLRGLHEGLGDTLHADVGRLSVSAKASGVGLASSAAGAAKRVFLLGPSAVVFVGTAGVYPGTEGYRPHDLVVARSATLLDHAASAGQATFPEPMRTSIEMHPGLRGGLRSTAPQVREAPVASPLAQTWDDGLAAQVTRQGPELENLELFAVAQVCQLANVPFGAVLGVTHVVGTHARTDWMQFQRQSSIAAGQLIWRWLQHGTPGLPFERGGSPRRE